MTLGRKVRGDAARRTLATRPLYATAGETVAVPRYRLPEHGMDPDQAYQIVHDELMLDGNARLNLATFCSTWMEPEAITLMAETLDKNMIDKDEYPQTAELEARCVHMLADLWHSPDRGGDHRLLDDRLERGGDARRPGPEVALAQRRQAAGSRSTGPTW